MKKRYVLPCLLFIILPLLSSGSGEKLDSLLEKLWKHKGITSVSEAPEGVFLRRASLNTAGVIPDYNETKNFLRDPSKDKKERLVEKLLASEDYADLMTMRFADMLRIKSEFPINLWPNAVQAFHAKIRRDILADRSVKEMVMEMLTASGSNFQIPYANTFRASADRTPGGLAKSIGRTFCGIDTSTLSPGRREAFANFFSRIRHKSTKEWKEEIVYMDPEEVCLKAVMPDGRRFTINTGKKDPRLVFAEALFDPAYRTFARAFVNRVWAWHFGKGLIGEEADAMPPENPSAVDRFFMDEELKIRYEILDFLAKEFAGNKYSLKKLCRLILRSKAYKAHYKTAIKEEYKTARSVFAVYPARRLEAEITADLLAKTVGHKERYMSVIPEPFTYVPRDYKAVEIDDGSISSGFLGNFGRPSRDAGTLEERNNSITDSQRLFLMNSARLFHACNRFSDSIMRTKGIQPEAAYYQIYLRLLNRPPTEIELGHIENRRKALKGNLWRVCRELSWALVNTREFLYHH